ncbi:hypothetical protein KI387_044730, partial [Taxus chinensis]
LAEILEDVVDNAIFIETMYEQMDHDNSRSLTIDWSVTEMTSITERAAQTIVHMKSCLISWCMNLKESNFSKIPIMSASEVGPSHGEKDK